MKKIRLSAGLLAVSLSILVGCGSNLPSASSSDTPPSQTISQDALFQPGTWLVESAETAAYYFFDADGISGRTASLENGMGVGFTYTADEENVFFSMGSADTVEKAEWSAADDTHATLIWADGREASMTFVCAEGSDAFQFFSNEELCAMAIAYYTETTGEAAPEAAADLGGQTVTIQLYNNLGDHNSTCAWYQVSRQTGKGVDINSGQEIDLAGD